MYFDELLAFRRECRQKELESITVPFHVDLHIPADLIAELDLPGESDELKTALEHRPSD